MGASLRQELTPLKAAAELEDIVLVLEVTMPAEAPNDEAHVRLAGEQASNCHRLTTTPSGTVHVRLDIVQRYFEAEGVEA